MTRQLKIGIIAAPERAAEIISQQIELLPDKFSSMIDHNIEWKAEWQIDPMTGAAETVQEILYNAVAIKRQQKWDYAICLTDLPIFHKKKVVAADISFYDQVAQISIPSYGWPPITKRIGRSIIHIISEMYHHDHPKDNRLEAMSSQVQARKDKRPSLKRRFPLILVRREEGPEMENPPHLGNSSTNTGVQLTAETAESNQQDTGNNQMKATNNGPDNEPGSRNIDVHYLIYPRVIGKLRLIMGMTFANNPFKIMSSFKSVIAIAFTTGAFALIFPTIWKLSRIFSAFRLTGLMMVAILGLAFWIITVHHLWEFPSSRNKPPIRRLYNLATASTLIIDVTAYYTMLYLLFFIAAVIFIPPDYLESTLPSNRDPAILNYMRVAWAEASISTIVSAMGAGLENDTTVRNLTYGYRQKQRYQKMKSHSDG